MPYTATIYSKGGNPRLRIEESSPGSLEQVIDRCKTRTDTVERDQ